MTAAERKRAQRIRDSRAAIAAIGDEQSASLRVLLAVLVQRGFRAPIGLMPAAALTAGWFVLTYILFPRTLPAGPLAVYTDGGLAGESALDRMKPGERRFIQYGHDLDVELTAVRSQGKDEPQRLSFEHDLDELPRTLPEGALLGARAQALREARQLQEQLRAQVRDPGVRARVVHDRLPAQKIEELRAPRLGQRVRGSGERAGRSGTEPSSQDVHERAPERGEGGAAGHGASLTVKILRVDDAVAAEVELQSARLEPRREPRGQRLPGPCLRRQRGRSGELVGVLRG